MSITSKLRGFLSLRWVVPLLVIGLTLLASLATLTVLKARLSAEIYENRLSSLSQEYGALRERYNQAVMRTAVTELVVDDGNLSVRIRTTAGVIREIPVACDPTSEVYVDYIIHDGRLWIRRVFDARTAPDDATVIDPAWAHLDWSDADLRYGKAVYRQLADGCWTITVTGNGSLGLVKSEAHDDDEALSAAPVVSDFKRAVESARKEAGEVGVMDVVKHIFGGAK